MKKSSFCGPSALSYCNPAPKKTFCADLDAFNSTVSYTATLIQPNDILHIVVSDLNPLVAAPFNNASAEGAAVICRNDETKRLLSHSENITLPF
jgi:polysaccharide export outer membrane protein